MKKRRFRRTPKRVPHVRSGASARARALIDACPSLTSKYHPSRWSSSPHVQIALFLAAMELDPPGRWDRVDRYTMEDGGTVGVSWHGLADALPNAPTLLVLPSITGSANDYRGLAQRLHKALGWPIALCDRRGNGDLPMTAPRFNTFGNVSDLRRQIAEIEALRPDRPLYAIGISAGGGLLVRYLGEEREASRIRGGVLSSPGFDIREVFRLTKPMYSKLMTKRLVEYFLIRHEDVLKDVPGYDACRKAKLLPEFHTHLYAMAGFDSEDAYFEASNPMGVAEDISVPILMLNAADDPVCTIEMVETYGPPLLKTSLHDSIMVVTDRGGHCGFYDGIRGRDSWAERTMIEYFAALAEQDGVGP